MSYSRYKSQEAIENLKKSSARYTKMHIKRYTLTCHDVNDYDLIEYLENQSNKNDILKKALRAYISAEAVPNADIIPGVGGDNLG